MFSKILIANRGEIACRVIATARSMGIATVAVYSDADAHARHVRLADEAIAIGPAPARESYLAGEKIIAAARATGAEAIHPGYGFLAENAEFAEGCAAAGLTFVGPPPAAIRAMGSKAAAKALMETAGVPVIPGYHGDSREEAFLQARADAIGYPLLVKASAGGGGKGMRRVERGEDFPAALAACRREGLASFGDDRVILEKCLDRPRHVEIQVFADTLGHCIHLFERDCSLQRRHQKVMEESPAPGMTPELRRAMGEAAVAAARAVGYVGAGTVEFLLAPHGSFHFMEMNTRLQVEHPVTELVTGQDLVAWQLRVAAGEPLPLAQDDLSIAGHAIEARIYAEDPGRDFLPSPGGIVHFALPPGVRVDVGYEAGDTVPAAYDPLLAKLVVHGPDRPAALARLARALAEFQVGGVATNLPFLARLAAFPDMLAGRVDTGLIERESASLLPPEAPVPRPALLAAAAAELLQESTAPRPGSDPHSPWHLADGWRLNLPSRRVLAFRDGERVAAVEAVYRAGSWEMAAEGETSAVLGQSLGGNRYAITADGRRFEATVVADGTRRLIFAAGGAYSLVVDNPLAGHDPGALPAGSLAAPLPGKVAAHLARPGERLEKGAPILILEAMKMEHTIAAPAAGVVRAFRYAVGEQVPEGAELADFEIEK